MVSVGIGIIPGYGIESISGAEKRLQAKPEGIEKTLIYPRSAFF
jgi:hypothetical protein